MTKELFINLGLTFLAVTVALVAYDKVIKPKLG